jgi:peptide/nickel transport system substrate-binding protein
MNRRARRGIYSRSAAITAAAATALVLAACSSSSSTPGASSSTGSSTGASSHDGTLTIAETADPTSFNPLQQAVTATYSVLRNLYDPLVDFADGGGDFTSYTPVLATSWKQLTPTELQFTLRQGVTFDGGQPFNSSSVVYTVNALLGKLPGASPAEQIQSFPTLTKAVANGPYTVTLYTSAPTQGLLSALTQLLIVPQGSQTSPTGSLASHPDGTGAYKMVSYTPDQSIVMTAKPNYFLGPAKIKKLVWETIPTTSGELAALLAGTVNVVFGLDPTDVSTVQNSPGAQVVTLPSTRVGGLWLDTLDYPYLKNQLVRQALNYAIDKQALVSSTLGGLGQVTPTIVPSYFTGYNPSVQAYPYDPAKAKALLKQAGYPNGFPLTIMFPANHYVQGAQIVQVLASELQQVGINAKIDSVSLATFAAATAKRKIPSSFYGAWGSNYPDPLQMFQIVVQGGTQGFSWFNSPSVNAAITAASSATSQSAYVADLQQVQTLISQQAAFVFLFAYKDAWGITKGLRWTPLSTEVENFYYASW